MASCIQKLPSGNESRVRKEETMKWYSKLSMRISSNENKCTNKNFLHSNVYLSFRKRRFNHQAVSEKRRGCCVKSYTIMKKHSHRISVSLYFSLINGQRQKFYLYTCFFFYFFSILNPSKSLFMSMKCVFNRNFMLKACSSVHLLSCHCTTKVLNSRAEAI